MFAAALLMAGITSYGKFSDSKASDLDGKSSDFALLEAVKTNKDGNKMVSKASLDAVLRLAAMGTSDLDLKKKLCQYTGLDENADIAEQIRELENSNDQSVLKSAYGIWVNEDFGLNKEFQDALSSLNARLSSFDPDRKKDAVLAINQFVDENTNHMIPSVMESPEGLTDLCMINTLYFDCKWKTPFKAESTYTDYFTQKNGEKMEASFMSEEGRTYYDDGQFIAYKKDYQGELYDFIIIMPKNKDTLDYDVSKIDVEKLMRKAQEKKVKVSLPKFEFDWMDENLRSIMEDSGLKDMFTGSKFDRILKIPCDAAAILQKTRVEVDEEGTKAAAVTSMMMTTSAMVQEKPIKIQFNRPFVFVIRNKKTNEHLFTGLVNHPEKQ